MARGSPGLHAPQPCLPNFSHRRRANAGGRRSILVAQPTRQPAKEAASHQPPCHRAKWLWAGPVTAALPACVPASPEALASQVSLVPQASPKPLWSFFRFLQVLERLCAEAQRLQRHPRLFRRRVRAATGCRFPPPPLAAALALSGATHGAAAALLARRPGGQALLDGPDHWDGSLGGRGFAPTSNPEPTPLGAD